MNVSKIYNAVDNCTLAATRERVFKSSIDSSILLTNC